MTARLMIGDVFDRLAELPDNSVDLVVTSPPFLALRSYLPADHPDKHKEIGSETTPAAFIDTLLALTAEWRRILAPHGSICVELGDTYSGAGGYGSPDSPNPAYGAGRFDERWTGRTAKRFKKKDDGWPLAKSLTGIPTLYPWSLAYGRNLLTGEPSPAGRWRIRNVIVWARPNPPVGFLADKFRPATSYITVACTGPKRYFDLESCRVSSTATGRTSLGVAAVRGEHVGALHTDHGSDVARWRCDFRFAQVSIDSAMTWNAKRDEVTQLVGLDVRVETAKGSYVVDLQPARCAAALAGVQVAVLGCLPGLLPVGASVVDPPASVCGAVLTDSVGGAPAAVTFETAEVVSLEGALVSGDRLAARLTLKTDGAITHAWLVAPLTRATHNTNSTESGTTTAGAPPLDWHSDMPDEDGDWLWKLATAPFAGAHYATYPLALPSRLIQAMCPQRVCTVCGKPSERIVDVAPGVGHLHQGNDGGTATIGGHPNGHRSQMGERQATTLGWTECGHDSYRPGLVLDPFSGSGTTLAAAIGCGRDAIGIDLDDRNAALTRERCGLFVETETGAP